MSFTTEITGQLMPAGRGTRGILCHQLHRTMQPLTVLHGVLELALSESHSVGDYRSAVEHALAESERVVGCIRQLRRLVEDMSTSGSDSGVEHV